MAENQQLVKKKRVASYVTTAVALELATLVGIAFATDGSPVPGIGLLATSIFIDGTKDILPTNDSQAADRMRDSLNGAYDQCPDNQCAAGADGIFDTADDIDGLGADGIPNTADDIDGSGADGIFGTADDFGPGADGKFGTADDDRNVFINYSRDFGVLTGGAGYNESKLEATDKTIQAIRDAQAQNPGQPIYVVGYSQGANASSDVIKRAQELNSDGDETNNLDLSDVTFVMVGNGARNNGGLWSRLPAGVYVPFLGLSFGASTPVQPTDDPNAPQVILISKQYDGASDVPNYVLNPVAWANTALGFLYVHNGYYADVDMDLDGDGDVDQADVALAEADDENYIVTRNGNVTDIVIKNKPGELPLTQPLLDLGVPPALVLALDPILRSIIEAGYDRTPDGGVYPSEPVQLGLIPHPGKLFRDFFAIAGALDQTEENLDGLNSANTLQAASGPGVVGNSLAKQVDPVPAVAPPAPPAPKPPVKQRPWPTFQLQQWVPPVTQQAPPPPVEEVPLPPAEELPPPAEDAVLVDADSLGNSAATSSTRPTGASSGAPGTTIKNVIKGIVAIPGQIIGALTPQPAGSPAPAATTPDPDPAPPSDPAPSDPGGDPAP